MRAHDTAPHHSQSAHFATAQSLLRLSAVHIGDTLSQIPARRLLRLNSFNAHESRLVVLVTLRATVHQKRAGHIQAVLVLLRLRRGLALLNHSGLNREGMSVSVGEKTFCTLFFLEILKLDTDQARRAVERRSRVLNLPTFA